MTAPGPVSGDYCHLLPHGEVEHYKCDDYRDGTVTSAITGRVVKEARWDAPMGFYRPN